MTQMIEEKTACTEYTVYAAQTYSFIFKEEFFISPRTGPRHLREAGSRIKMKMMQQDEQNTSIYYKKETINHFFSSCFQWNSYQKN